VRCHRCGTALNLDHVLATSMHRFAGMVRERARSVAHLSDDDAEDVAQEVWIKLWRAMQCDPTRRVSSAYVYRVAMNVLIDRLRFARAKNRGDELSMDTLPDVECGAHGPESRLAVAESARSLLQAVETLPAPRRNAVRLRLLGHSVGEIATLLGTTEASVAKLLQRGLRQLRKQVAAIA
jgi:RNA polymerase sigma-70 factor (ECF subfamily)